MFTTLGVFGLVIQAIAVYLFADFLSGLYHWIEDRYFGDEWPLIGAYVSKPNGRHHDDPTAMLRISYAQRNGASIVAAAIAIQITVLAHGPIWLMIAFALASQANETHAWAHKRVQNRLIRGLQEFGVFQSPRHHAGHHKAPHDQRYCTLSDWLNPVLDRLRFWRALEVVADRVFGLPVLNAH